MAEGFHPPLEEYLEAILEFEEEGTAAIQARLAERLEHSAPAVSEMVRRLRDEGWVEVAGRTLALTPAGRTLAESVVRKHRLAERLLTDIIGLPWANAHVEACRWEHVISDEVAERLVILLGHPTTCPHGNPIRLERVTEQIEIDRDALTYLSDHGFLPGTDAVVASRAPDGSLTLRVGDDTMALGPALAAQLFVADGAPAPA